MKPVLFRSTALGLLCLAPALAAAQEPPSLDPIVVTASRQPEPQSQALGDVSVISRQSLNEAGAQSVAEILAARHGIELYNSGGPQNTTGLFLRGNDASHTLVLLDGVRINSSNYGGINWNAIDPSAIERIEVLRGAASSLYGSDAIGGVVNIVTRRGQADRPLSAFANIGYGSFDTFRSSAGFSGAQDGWHFNLTGSRNESRGFDATRPQSDSAFPDQDGYRQHSVSGSLGYTWQPGQDITLTAYNDYIEGDFDAGSSNPALTQTRQQVYSIASTNQVTDYWQSVLRFGLSKEDNTSYTGTYDPYVAGSINRSWSWQNNFDLTDDQSVSILTERQEERPSGTMDFAVDHRDTNSVGLIYKGRFGRHRVQANVRADQLSAYGRHTTGGLSYDLELTPHWKAGLAANTGFQAPSFGDLYAKYGSSKGNPNLEPEESRNVEAHLDYSKGPLDLGVLAYHNRVRNLIVSRQQHMENVNSALLRGVTLKAGYRWDATHVSASADFQDPRDVGSDQVLIRRARHLYRLNIDQRLESWTLGAEMRYTGRREDDVYGKGRVELGGYTLWNVRAETQLNKQLALQVRWDNVTGKDYTYVYGYATPGSNVFVNLRWQM